MGCFWNLLSPISSHALNRGNAGRETRCHCDASCRADRMLRLCRAATARTVVVGRRALRASVLRDVRRRLPVTKNSASSQVQRSFATQAPASNSDSGNDFRQYNHFDRRDGTRDRSSKSGWKCPMESRPRCRTNFQCYRTGFTKSNHCLFEYSE